MCCPSLYPAGSGLPGLHVLHLVVSNRKIQKNDTMVLVTGVQV